MANPIKSLIGQTAVYGVSSILGRFINYLLVPLYTYVFLKYEYGIVTELTAYVGFLLIVLTYGMETGLFRYSQQKDFTKQQVYSTVSTSVLATTLIFIIFVFLFYDNIAQLLDYTNHPEYILMLGVTVGIDAFSAIPFAELRIQNKAKRFAIIKLSNIGLNVGFNLFFIVLCPKFCGENNFIYSLFYHRLDVGYIFISYLLASFITLFLLLPEIRMAFVHYQFSASLLKKILKYSLPLMLAGLAGMTTDTLDRILLKYLIVVPEGVANAHQYIMGQIGVYGANAKIAILMVLFIQAFRYAAEPFFFNYSDKSDAKELYALVMKYFVIFGLLVFVGITLLIDIVKYFIGESYREGLVVVPILLISKLLFGIVFNLSIWYKLTNKTKYGAYLAFTGALVSISLNFILIPYFGYYGAAWSSIGSYSVMVLLSFFLSRKYYKINYDIKNISLYFMLALVIYFINLYIKQVFDLYLVINVLMIISFLFFIYKREGFLLSNWFKRN
ncbi:MAG: polysaccharide biosynthesis C-terminal domain-containing protein [Bacteroidales bacterium]|nr:polysaccharide biosynthesis C-terminal domain-containing protein [Bacteroidales bacterium]